MNKSAEKAFIEFNYGVGQLNNIIDLMGKPNTTKHIILSQSATNHRRIILILEAGCMIIPPRNIAPNTYSHFLTIAF